MTEMAKPPRTLQIGEVAAEAGLTVEAVRFYERKGILPRAPRTAGGFRLYDERVVDRIRFVKQAQALGLSLREIQRLLSDRQRRGSAACRHVRDLLAQHITDIDRRISELKALRRTLSDYRSTCEQALHQEPEPECPTLDALDTSRTRPAR
jgi:MerR family transcriptional regulator, copper efflux regulator